MAQQYQSATFGTLTIPQAVATYNVQTSNSGLAANGIVIIVGEADAGPDYTLEADLNANSFGPSSVGDVIAKYQSGPIVDAVSAWSAPANDPNIPGSPTAFIIAKTNPSAQATGLLLTSTPSTYATLGALLRGAGGNNITYQVVAATSTAVPQYAPSTGTFSFAPPETAVDLAARVNGGPSLPLTIAVSVTPTVTVAEFNTNLTGSGAIASGGVNRGILVNASTGDLSMTVSGLSVTITRTTPPGALAWDTQPAVGDTLVVPAASVLVTAGTAANEGSYVITAVTSNTITATKVANTPGAGLSPITDPTPVVATAIGAVGASEINAYSPIAINITAAATQIAAASNSAALPQATLNVATTAGFPTSGTIIVASSTGLQTLTYTGVTGSTFTGVSGGTGTITTGNEVYLPGGTLNGQVQTLEIADLGTGASFTTTAFQLGTSTPVEFVSTAANPTGTQDSVPLTGSSGNQIQLLVNNVVTNVQETLPAVGGEIGLSLGYAGTTAQVVVNATSLVFTFTGGPNLAPGHTFTLTFKNYPNIASIAAFLNTQLGFTASAGTNLLGFLPSTALDEGTYQIASTFGAPTGNIKIDAYRFITRDIAASSLIGLVGTLPTAGLPAVMATASALTGGTRGFTTNANVTGALDATQNVVGNFTVTLFSQDASADILIGETDPSSTYTIDLINAYAKTNVLLCSQSKRKKSRQAFLSINDTFVNDQSASGSIASFRCSMAFQSVQNISASANAIVLFQPWMLAGLAASMQAAAGYKGIVNKYINCSSVIQAGAGAIPDYNDQNDDNETTALQAGLLPAKRDLNAGGVFFVSDQTTYGSDSNFVFNSIQAIYVADTMALTLAMRMQRAFVGQSLADISAAQAVSTVQNILADFLTLKLIAPSDGAPKGYQPGSIVCKISGTVMTVNLTVYLAGLLYFVPIVFQINQVQQTASA